MKILVKRDMIAIASGSTMNAGAINFYEITFDFSSEWNDLTKKLIVIKNGEGTEVAIIDNSTYVPDLDNGTYYFGVVGYSIVDSVKTLQISSNLLKIKVDKGAGEFETTTQEIPIPSVWEQYVNTMNSILAQTTSAKETAEGYKTEVEILKEEIETLKEETETIKNTAQDLVSAVTFASFDIDLETGDMYLNNSESLGNMGFDINYETGDLEVEING